jgi:hypothetical protein
MMRFKMMEQLHALISRTEHEQRRLFLRTNRPSMNTISAADSAGLVTPYSVRVGAILELEGGGRWYPRA